MNDEPGTQTALRRYDDVPYRGGAIRGTHPDQIQAMGILFGLEPAPASTARVLEIGCGTGTNIIAIAHSLPASECVGIDLSARQIEMGNALIRDLALENVELEALDVGKASAALGAFDYIICHGVYSWVPHAIRESILSLCRQHLSAQGIAYISYNTYPGWAQQETLRQMLLNEARGLNGAEAQIAAARALVRRIAADTASSDSARHDELVKLAGVVARLPDFYLFHEYLEPSSRAVYFCEFIELARHHELAFLGEWNLSQMSLNQQPEGQARAQKLFGDDVLQIEQYADHLLQTTMRRTLICHAGAGIQRDGLEQRLQRLCFAATCEPKAPGFSLKPGVTQEFIFIEDTDQSIATDEAPVKATLACLHSAYPARLDLATLWERVVRALAEAGVDKRPSREAFRASLLDWLRLGLLSAHSGAPMLVTEVGERPLASPLARRLAQESGRIVAPTHRGLNLDDAGRHMLQALDGTKTRSELADELAQRVASGEIKIKGRDGKPIRDAAAIKRVVAKSLDDALPRFARLGLLQG